jgi:hypothetical protein
VWLSDVSKISDFSATIIVECAALVTVRAPGEIWITDTGARLCDAT